MRAIFLEQHGCGEFDLIIVTRGSWLCTRVLVVLGGGTLNSKKKQK